MNSHDKQFKESSKRAYQRKQILFARDDFKADITEIRKKWKFPKVEFGIEGDHQKLFDWLEKQPEAQIKKDVIEIVKKYKLGPSWIEGVYMYALWNNPSLMPRKIGLDIDIRINEDTGLQELWLRVDPDSTLKDVKAAWNLVKYNQRLLDYADKKKFQPIKVTERDAFAYKLQKEGLKLREIAELISEKFPRLSGDDYWWNDVSKMIERHKKRHDIN